MLVGGLPAFDDQGDASRCAFMPRKSANTSRKDITKSIKVEAADEATIKAAVAKWPWKSEADLIRTALRVGFLSLTKDPTPLGQPPVSPESFGSAEEDQSPLADETLPPGASTLRATPVASVDLSAPAVQRAKEAREEETAAEEERRPRVSTSKIIRRELEDPPVLPGDPKRRDRRRKPGQAPS
jgi:hypothetical protein